METTDIPHHELELDGNVTPAAQRVYRILMVGIGADGSLGTPVPMSDELFPSDEETK